MSKIDHSLFHTRQLAPEEAFGKCPECEAPLQINHGKRGTFLGCSRYPECDFTKSLHDTDTTEIKQMDGSECPQCTSTLAIKKGRFGLFIGCTNFPDCHYIGSMKQQDDTQTECPSCQSGHLIKRANKFGKNFYACSTYPKCKYALNHPPVQHSCPKCDWPVMVERKSAQGKVLQCPQRDCQYKQVR